MLSIASGHSAEYLTGSVAQGRESYYLDATASDGSMVGEPPGRWWGRGAERFGLTGEVDNDQMEALFARFRDPRDHRWDDPATREQAARLGRAPGRYKTAEEILADRLAAEPDALPERVEELRTEAERQERQPVAFVDATFSPPKSVTVLHTAYARMELDAQRAGDQDAAGHWAAKRTAVEDAIWAGNRAMLEHMSDQAGYSRAGRHGAGAGRWVDAHDWTVASFFQHTSRDLDPQLHIHNAILNRVVCPDGQVRTLDSQAIHRHKQGAGTIGDRVMEATLTRSLGVQWVMRADQAGREVAGVDQAAMDLFSERSAKIGRKLAVEVEAFRQHFQREPSAIELDRLRRQSSMATRRAKTHDGETRGEQLDRWDTKLRAEVAGGLHRVARTVGAGPDLDALDGEKFSPQGVIAEAVARCQESRAAFSRSELLRQVLLALPDNLATDRVADLATRLADQALADGDLVVRVTGAQPTRTVPAELRVASGQTSYLAPGGPRFATRSHIVAEQALRRAAVDRGGLAIDPAKVQRWMGASAAGEALKPDQRAAVVGLLTSGARVSVLVGPAGTGKSFTLGAMSAAWSDLTEGGRVIGLATSQIATEVLSADMAEARARERVQELADDGVMAQNTARWLATQERLHTPGGGGPRDRAWQLTERDLVVVDEASMVDTAVLERVRAYVAQAGARLVLAGDPRQLAAVGAGGAMEMLADGVAETHTLVEVRRFHAKWEAAASLQLRDGDPTALAEYDRRGRVIDAGTLESAGASAARAYLGDTLAGKRSLVVTATNQAAAQVAGHIREQLVQLGRVDQDGVILGRDGNLAGVGDLVQARHNDWAAGTVNRRRYVVQAVHDDGGMTVTPENGGQPVRLSPAYVAEDVTLGYASTAHSAQGITVDTAHAVATSAMAPEALYVAMSRGRESNTAHVATQAEVAGERTGETHGRERRTPLAVLGDVLAKDVDQEKAALVQAAEDARTARSMHTVLAHREDAIRELGEWRTARWLDRLADEGAISEAEREAFSADQATGQLGRLLRTVEQAGHDPEAVLRTAIVGRSLDGLRSVAQGVHGRITESFAEAGLAPISDHAGDLDVVAGVPEPWRDYLAELGEVADERRRELGAQVAEELPQWAVESLGQVPEDVVERAEWEHKAGLVAAHREATNWTDEEVPVGPATGMSSTERRASWHAAWTALGRPEAGQDEKDLTEGQLRIRVRAWEREQTWAPRYVNDEMRATGQAVARHRQEAEILAARAAVAEDAEERVRLLQESEDRRELAETLAEVEAGLARVAEDRAAWHVETAATRLAALQAKSELAERGLDIGAEPDRVTAEEWLAAHDEAMREEDPYREATAVDAPAEVWDEELGDLVQVVDLVEDSASDDAAGLEAPAVENVVEAQVVEEEQVATDQDGQDAGDQDDVVDAEVVEETPAAEVPVESEDQDVVDAQVVADETAAKDKEQAEQAAEDKEAEEQAAEDKAGPGIPTIAATVLAVAAAKLAGEELANRRSQDEARRVADDTQRALAEQEAREAAYRARERGREQSARDVRDDAMDSGR